MSLLFSPTEKAAFAMKKNASTYDILHTYCMVYAVGAVKC